MRKLTNFLVPLTAGAVALAGCLDDVKIPQRQINMHNIGKSDITLKNGTNVSLDFSCLYGNYHLIVKHPDSTSVEYITDKDTLTINNLKLNGKNYSFNSLPSDVQSDAIRQFNAYMDSIYNNIQEDKQRKADSTRIEFDKLRSQINR